jgi:hypothetical protein
VTARNGDEALEAIEFGLDLRRRLDSQRRFDQVAFGNRDTSFVERPDQVLPRQSWRTMKRWIAAEHLVNAVLDVVKVDPMLDENETISFFAIIGTSRAWSRP